MSDESGSTGERTCDKCAQPLSTCPACAGQGGGFSIAGRLTCTECGDTGVLCPTHGKCWRA